MSDFRGHEGHDSAGGDDGGPRTLSMAPRIHPSAIVEPGAEIGDGVQVGPWCLISSGARIGRGTTLANNVTVLGDVRIGEENRLHSNCVVGGEPQDVSYRGSRTRVVIGDRNVIREGVTINRATEKEEGETVLGSDNFLMAGCHVAHDCRVGDHVMMANAVLLGGHVRVHSHASLSGGVAVHHWVTVGSWSFVAGLSRVLHDIPPYMLCEGMPARPRCVNVVALRRRGTDERWIASLVEAHRLLHRAKVGLDAAREILVSKGMDVPPVGQVLDFAARQKGGRHGRALERRMVA